MLAAVLLTLAIATFQPVTTQNSAQPAGVFVRDAGAPAVVAPSDAVPGAEILAHDAGFRPPADNDFPELPLFNANGAQLAPTLGRFRAATGQLEIEPVPGGPSRLTASFRGLVPFGRYSLFVRQLAGRTGVALTPLDVTGETNNLSADADGNAGIAVAASNALPSGAQIVLIYHSDGQDHRSSVGNVGVNAHVQLITRLP